MARTSRRRDRYRHDRWHVDADLAGRRLGSAFDDWSRVDADRRTDRGIDSLASGARTDARRETALAGRAGRLRVRVVDRRDESFDRVDLREAPALSGVAPPRGALAHVAAPRPTARGLRRQILLLRADVGGGRSEEHTSELQSLRHLVCRL